MESYAAATILAVYFAFLRSSKQCILLELVLFNKRMKITEFV